MSIHFPIGTDSSNLPFNIRLEHSGNLFISYAKGEQYFDIANRIVKASSKSNMRFSIAASSEKSATYFNTIISQNQLLLTDSFLPGNIGQQAFTKPAFLSGIAKEIRSRKAKPLIEHPLLVVFIDDIFDFIAKLNKKAGMDLISMLREGGEVNIHLVAGSRWSYYNLSKQLIHLHPAAITTPAGTEIVINSDDMVYVKTGLSHDYTRFYPVTQPNVENRINFRLEDYNS
jgi:hypothetical protein